jgi:hypothetical protein
MSENGYVLAYRGAWSHPVFNNLREAAIWNFLYQNAFWKDGQRNFNGQLFDLKRGQIVVSVSFLASGFVMTEKGVRVVIQKLEKQGMIIVNGASRGTIITICNYDKFQQIKNPEGQPEGNQRASRGRAEGDNKKQLNKLINVNSLNTPLPPKGVQKPDDVSDQTWDDFLNIRKSLKAPVTETALKGIRREATKAGISLDAAMQTICAQGWRGFRADWIKDKNKPERQSDQSDMEKQKQILGIL